MRVKRVYQMVNRIPGAEIPIDVAKANPQPRSCLVCGRSPAPLTWLLGEFIYCLGCAADFRHMMEGR